MTWRVGVLFSQTGVTAAIERSQLNATLLAIEEINKAGGVLGRPIEPVFTIPPPTLSNSASLAERLADDRSGAADLRMLHVEYAQSVLPVVEAFRGLLFYPTLYEGFEYSPHCIYTGAAPNQNSLQLARFLLPALRQPVSADRIELRLSVRIQPGDDRFGGAGRSGKVLDEIYVPLDAEPPGFRQGHQHRSRSSKPDVVFSTVVGQRTAVFYEAYQARRLRSDNADRQPDDQRSRGRRDEPRGRRRPYHGGAFL